MKRKIKVAIVAPPFGDWGGPEVVVQNLVLELVKKNIDATLFCPEDWKTKVKRVPTLKQSLWNMKDFKKQTKVERSNLVVYSQIKVLDYQNDFDIIHLHSQRQAYVVGKMLHKPCVLTMHSVMEKKDFQQLKEANVKVISLTKAQKEGLETFATIKNGVPFSGIEPSLKKGKYLIAVARLTPQKGIDLAIKIAKSAKMKLLIFGRINKSYIDYYNKDVKPLIDGKKIVLMKEVAHKKIFGYLRDAKALLFTISKLESCPMVVAEALACGTPVIGTKIEPLPEMLGKNEKATFLSNDIKELVNTVKQVDEKFDRQECRNYAEKYFSSSYMADEYIKVYQRILALKKK